jgi:hypothetical protein
MVDLGANAAIVDVLDAAQFLGGQGRHARCGGVLPRLLRVPCARDHGGDAGLLDDPAQRGLRLENKR